VLVRQQGVLATARFLQRAVDHSLGRLGHLVLRDIEVFHDVCLHTHTEQDLVQA
jgi:hypothetical protein